MTSRHISLGFSIAIFLFAALYAGAALAQSGGAAAAEVLFDQGREAMERRDYETACQRFRESEQIDPAPGTKLNLADCEEKRGRIASAWELFRAALRDLPDSDERHGIAEARAAALQKRLPMLTLRLAAGAPPSTRVRVGAAELGSGSFGVPLPLDPGKHTLVVSAPGYPSKSVEVVLTENRAQVLEVGPGAASAKTDGAAPAGVEAETPASVPSRGSKTLGYVFGGIGLLGLAVGGVTGAIVLSKKSTAEEQCDDDVRECTATGKAANDSGRALAPITTASLIIGVVGVGAGAYFILSASETSETALNVRAAPGVSQVTLVRSW